jgi:hypothetical protein
MPESYKPIFPGNAVQHIHSYGLPNPDFITNNRASGDPRDRNHQALVSIPGWYAVRKVGYSLITGAGATSFGITVPSPDTRQSDKPRADINGLHIPTGAALFRLGFRVLDRNRQPGANTSGPSISDNAPVVSGLTGTNGDMLVLAHAPIAALAVGTITATTARTSSNTGSSTDPAVRVVTGGQVSVGTQSFQAAFGSPVILTADLTLSLYSVAAAGNAAGSAIGSNLSSGCYVISEVDYLVPEPIAGLDAVHLPGARYAGFGS